MEGSQQESKGQLQPSNQEVKQAPQIEAIQQGVQEVQIEPQQLLQGAVGVRQAELQQPQYAQSRFLGRSQPSRSNGQAPEEPKRSGCDCCSIS